MSVAFVPAVEIVLTPGMCTEPKPCCAYGHAARAAKATVSPAVFQSGSVVENTYVSPATIVAAVKFSVIPVPGIAYVRDTPRLIDGENDRPASSEIWISGAGEAVPIVAFCITRTWTKYVSNGAPVTVITEMPVPVCVTAVLTPAVADLAGHARMVPPDCVGGAAASARGPQPNVLLSVVIDRVATIWPMVPALDV